MSVVTYTFWAPDKATGGPNGPVNIIVIHDVECPLGNDSTGTGYARSLIGPNYFGNPGMTQIKSIHYITGATDICQGVDEDTLAWHARGASKGSIGIEQEGYARFTAAEWASPLGMQMLHNTALLLADIAGRRGIPLRFITGQALRDAYANHGDVAAGGVTTHRALTESGVGGNDHTDPGAEYPMDYVLDLARSGGTSPVEQDYLTWLLEGAA